MAGANSTKQSAQVHFQKRKVGRRKRQTKKTEGKRNEACGGEFVGCGGEAAERYGCCAGKEAASVAAVRLEQARLEIE